MRIGILSRNANNYSTTRLIQAAEDRGHEVKVINPLKGYMNITASIPDVHYINKNIQKKLEFDAV